ncbi:hypothetical protein BREVNS_0434 [Brevinematales bacterium NS]|nr:hypothetical protein BREVNS_0434 [Brevinematales bacterium NS]
MRNLIPKLTKNSSNLHRFFIFETLARVFSSPVWVRGYAPETPLFLFTRAYLSFFIQKSDYVSNRRPERERKG